MATFTISTTIATFRAVIRGSRQEAGDVQRLTLGVFVDTETEWAYLQSLVTTKYHVHTPLGNPVVLDIVNGPGEGLLEIDGLGGGGGSAVLVGLDRSTWVPHDRSGGTATFLVTAGVF